VVISVGGLPWPAQVREPEQKRGGAGMRNTAEAVIIGGGVVGCSLLYNLAIRGMSNLVLLERDVIASGGTGRSQAISRMHYSNPFTTLMAWKSLKLLRNFEDAVGGPSGFVQTGYMLIVGSEAKAAVEQNVAMHQALGVNVQLITPAAAKAVAPMFELDDAAAIVYEPESGYSDPYAVASTYARRAQDMGAEVNLWTPVTGIRTSHGRVEAVQTAQGDIATPRAVVAAGPWSRALFQDIGLDLPIQPMRHQVTILRRPQDLLPDHPIISDLINNIGLRPDGGNLTLLGVNDADAFVDLDTYNPGVDMATVADGMRRMVRRCPLLRHAYFRGGWAGVYDVTPDWHPILDAVEGVEGLYCAAGFSGHGFKLSPMIGVVMAELITQGRATSVDISPMRWGRFRTGNLITSRHGYKVLA
jgi:sarcosine oxidase subunit beta